MIHGIRISIISAMAHGRAIGRANDIPWHVPEDFKHFKDTTMGKPVIMGRDTAESLMARRKGALLPGRTNIVLTRNPAWTHTDAIVCATLDDALNAAARQAQTDGQDEVFIIGGANVYAQALPLADRLYLTELDIDIDNADAFFPTFNGADYIALHDETITAASGMRVRFVTYGTR